MTQPKNMLLIKGTVNHEGNKRATFKLIPLTIECPYMEALYHPVYRGFGIVGKFKKQAYEMIPAIDKNGDLVPKKRKTKEGEYPYIQERRLVENWNEYELLTKEDILNFIDMFAVNADTFDVATFLKEPEPEVIAPNITSKPVKPVKDIPVVDMTATVTPEKEKTEA